VRDDHTGTQQALMQAVEPIVGGRVLRHIAVVGKRPVGRHDLEQRAVARRLRQVVAIAAAVRVPEMDAGLRRHVREARCARALGSGLTAEG
jgi:hypothetical protein